MLPENLIHWVLPREERPYELEHQAVDAKQPADCGALAETLLNAVVKHA